MKVESTTATIGGEKEKEVPHEQKEGDEKENKGEEKESKGDEKDTKGEKEKWKEPENVEMMYTPPEWSSAPKHSFFIDVLKNGTIVETIDLSKKEHFLIGMYSPPPPLSLSSPSPLPLLFLPPPFIFFIFF